MPAPYDPPSEHVLTTIRAEIGVALEQAQRDAERMMSADTAIDVTIPPIISEVDIHHRCRDDWRGGNPGPGTGLILSQLAAAGAICPVTDTVRQALIAANERRASGWHHDYLDTWEVVDLSAARHLLPERPRQTSMVSTNPVDTGSSGGDATNRLDCFTVTFPAITTTAGRTSLLPTLAALLVGSVAAMLLARVIPAHQASTTWMLFAFVGLTAAGIGVVGRHVRRQRSVLRVTISFEPGALNVAAGAIFTRIPLASVTELRWRSGHRPQVRIWHGHRWLISLLPAPLRAGDTSRTSVPPLPAAVVQALTDVGLTMRRPDQDEMCFVRSPG